MRGIMKPISAVAALSVVGVLACDPVVQPEAPTPNFAGRGGVVESVTGSGHFRRRTFTVSAQRFADGSVTGQWERINHVAGGGEAEFRSHGVVTCFNNVGSSVFIGGLATGGRKSTPPNNGVAWRVADNGPGGATDQNSFQFTGAPPLDVADYCNLVFDEIPTLFTILFTILRGNITVR